VFSWRIFPFPGFSSTRDDIFFFLRSCCVWRLSELLEADPLSFCDVFWSGHRDLLLLVIVFFFHQRAYKVVSHRIGFRRIFLLVHFPPSWWFRPGLHFFSRFPWEGVFRSTPIFRRSTLIRECRSSFIAFFSYSSFSSGASVATAIVSLLLGVGLLFLEALGAVFANVFLLCFVAGSG